MARLGRHSKLGGHSLQWIMKHLYEGDRVLLGGEWVKLLTNSPADLRRYREFCNWRMLGGYDWVVALDRNPDIWEECNDFSALSGEDWICILKVHPEVKDDCDWDAVEGAHWVDLLIEQPQFCEAHDWDWSTLTADEWVHLLRKRPDLAKEMEHTADNLSAVIGAGMGDLCGMEDIKEEDRWVDLIHRNPRCFNYCEKRNLSEKAWGSLFEIRHLLKVEIPE